MQVGGTSGIDASVAAFLFAFACYHASCSQLDSFEDDRGSIEEAL